MSEYIVSARKYRPMTFDSVVGQDSIAATLKNAIHSSKLAHAYLFCGPRGVGKTTCARIFAKTINCMNLKPDGEACNECESCRAFNEGRSLNIHELDAASNNSVDDIRNLTEQVRIPPQIGKYKVFIIDEVHMLSTAAFNAFLKTLEEPPAHAIFILATTEKHKILPTILSRCQIYDFQRMSVDNIIQHLAHVADREGYTTEPAALNVIAQKADGGMRDALSIFDQVVSFTSGNITYQRVIENLNVLDYDYYFRLVDMMLEQRITDSLLLLNEILNKGFDGAPFISGLATHLRDVLVCRDPETAQLLEASEEIRKRYVEQAQRCKAKWLYRAIRLCNDCDQAYRNSRNKRLQVELCLIECAQAVTDDDESSGRSPIRRLKKLFGLSANVGPSQQPQQAATIPTAAVATSSSASFDSTQVPLSQTTQTAVAEPSVPVTSISMGGVSHASKGSAAIPRAKLGKLSPSIHRRSTSPVATAEPIKAAPAVDESKPFTLTDLLLQWQAFISTMPREETAMSQRMRIMQPALSKDNPLQVEILLENNDVLQEMKRLESRLLTFLRNELHNTHLILEFRVAEFQAQEHIYDKREQLRHMCDQNPALISLGKVFKLNFS